MTKAQFLANLTSDLAWAHFEKERARQAGVALRPSARQHRARCAATLRQLKRGCRLWDGRDDGPGRMPPEFAYHWEGLSPRDFIKEIMRAARRFNGATT